MLDYLGGPNVISRILLKSRKGNQERTSKKEQRGGLGLMLSLKLEEGARS